MPVAGKRPAARPMVDLMFMRAFRNHIHKDNVWFRNIGEIRSENVVLHFSTTLTEQACEDWSLLGIKGSRVNNRKHWTDAELKAYSNTNRDSPFQHTCLLSVGQDGKTLLFDDGNGIRAGRSIVAHGYLNAHRLGRFINSGRRYTAMSIPNSVVCGTFRRPLKETIKRTFQTVHNKKFPGVAVSLKRQETRCTPELYTGRNKTNIQNQSKFIAPGFKRVDELVHAAEELDDLSMAHAIHTLPQRPQ